MKTVGVGEEKKYASTGLTLDMVGAVHVASSLLEEGEGHKPSRIEYALPDICCICGQKEPAQNRHIQFKGNKHTYLFSSKRLIYNIEAPMCETCYDKKNLILGRFNGRYYEFYNKDFQKQFEELNPFWKDLVPRPTITCVSMLKLFAIAVVISIVVVAILLLVSQ